MKNERIVVTGLGIYSPIGKNKEEVRNSIMASSSGFNTIDEFDVTHLRNDTAGVIKDIDNVDTINGLRINILLKHAVQEAIQDAGVETYKDLDRTKVGVSIGTSIGGYGGLVDQLIYKHEQNEEDVVPQDLQVPLSELNPHSTLTTREIFMNLSPALLSYEVAKEYNFSGFVTSSITACSAGANAIGMARDLILSDHVDMVVVGGVDPLTQLTYLGFNALMALSKDTIKPMDDKRGGLLIGEGAACLILEKESLALKRKAKIYGVVSGCGVTNDAHHVTQPHPNAVGATLAIQNALKDADIKADDIDYVNLHGTGTRHNDLMEIKALHNIFGKDFNVPISSSKSMMGHTLGAAGAIEAAICLICLNEDMIPPNLNNDEKIKGFEYDLVRETRKEVKIRHILSNSFGFGGNCTALILSEFRKRA